jgi:hypothetical protein
MKHRWWFIKVVLGMQDRDGGLDGGRSRLLLRETVTKVRSEPPDRAGNDKKWNTLCNDIFATGKK